MIAFGLWAELLAKLSCRCGDEHHWNDVKLRET